jgi:hypothetical protein
LEVIVQFYDCNAYFGRPSVRPLMPVATAGELLTEMDQNGVSQALVWHIVQHDGSPQVGNKLLAEAIQDQPRLSGCWTILPNQTKEFPPVKQFIMDMRNARVFGLRAYPISHHFLLNGVSMGSWLEAMVARQIPLFLSVARGANWEIAYALLAEFPELVCVICDHGCWGEDRRFRPLIERYPNVYIDTSQYLLDGGIEDFVASYGPKRMLYGSGFPESYFGGMMLAILHAKISNEDKEGIAGKNLERLLSQINLEVRE